MLHLLLGGVGVDQAPAALADHGFLGVTWWDWLAGPSVAMSAFILMAVFTTSGTFMLLFIAALQNIGDEIEEAGMVDGAAPGSGSGTSRCRCCARRCSPSSPSA